MATKTSAPARTPDVACTIDSTLLRVSFTFPNDASLDPIIIDAMSLPSEVRDYAMLHGFKQRIGDAAAISRNPDTGRSATPADKRDAMARVAETLRETWTMRQPGDGTSDKGLLFRALCLAFPSTAPDAIRARLDARTKAEQAAMLRAGELAVHVAAVRAADAAKAPKVDTAALLADFEFAIVAE